MSNIVLTYDPKQVCFIVGSAIMAGYTDGTFIHVERNEDMWATKIGCDGVGTRAKSNNKSAKITLTLHQSSASNDVLSALAAADELANTGVVPYLLRDASGRTLSSSLSCWVTKYAPVDFGKEVTDRAWVIETNSADLFVGGN